MSDVRDALRTLLSAAEAERDQLSVKLAEIDAEKAELQAEIKRYDRVINAANPTPNAKKKPEPKAPRKPDWRVSSGMIEQVYEAMVVAAQNNGKDEFTITELADLAHVSTMTAGKTVNILHEQGRVRLVRKNKQSRFWGVVA